MKYLFATTDIIRTTTSSAAAVDIVLHYQEAVTATGAVASFGRAVAALSSATSNDTLAGPGGSNFRTLKQGTWRNKDASLAVDVTIIYRITGPVDYEMFKTTLQPGESITYIEGIGFFVNKLTPLLDKMLIMSADVSNSTTSFADITGLTVPLLSGKKYSILASLFHISGVTTTGINFGYNIGAAPTAAQFANISGVTNSVTAGAISLGSATARDTAITAQTTGSANITQTILGGFIQPSADGTFALRVSAEVAAIVTVKTGSWLEVRQER